MSPKYLCKLENAKLHYPRRYYDFKKEYSNISNASLFSTLKKKHPNTVLLKNKKEDERKPK